MDAPLYRPSGEKGLRDIFEQAREIARDGDGAGICHIDLTGTGIADLFVFADDSWEGFTTECRRVGQKDRTMVDLTALARDEKVVSAVWSALQKDRKIEVTSRGGDDVWPGITDYTR